MRGLKYIIQMVRFFNHTSMYPTVMDDNAYADVVANVTLLTVLGRGATLWRVCSGMGRDYPYCSQLNPSYCWRRPHSCPISRWDTGSRCCAIFAMSWYVANVPIWQCPSTYCPCCAELHATAEHQLVSMTSKFTRFCFYWTLMGWDGHPYQTSSTPWYREWFDKESCSFECELDTQLPSMREVETPNA